MQPVQAYWDQCLQQLRESAGFVDTATETQWADPAPEVVDYLLQTLASSYILVARGDPDFPEFIPWLNPVFTYAGGNPDATYYFCVIDGRNRYRIVGQRNTVDWVDFLTGRDYWGFADTPGNSYPSVQMDGFEVGADGRFEILLSNEKPPDHAGNWMKLEPDVNYLVVRQFANGPDEVDVRMAIEKLGDDHIPTQPEGERIRHRITEILRHLKNSSLAWPSFPRRLQKRENFRFNEIPATSYGNTGEVWGQAYNQGLFHIELDQALIVSFKVPDQCRYWNIQLSDLWWRTLEAVRRQGHLNGFKNRADADGITRLVISHRDPGLENWIDAGGVIEGDIIMRFLYVDSRPDVSAQLVNLDELERHLPVDSKRVSPQERALALRERRLKKQLRRSW